MDILITLCMRKGSKRLPGKNIKNFCGRPLFEWTLKQAFTFKRQRPCDNVEIVLSTDYKKKEMATPLIDAYGVSYCERNPDLARDKTPKIPVIKDLVEWHILKENKACYDVIIDLDVTAPLRKSGDIQNALDQYLINKECVNLFSVTKSRKTIDFNQAPKSGHTGLIDTAYKVPFINGKFKYYDLNASIYIYPLWFILEEKELICQNSGLYIMEDWQAFDIDTQTDWEIAEMFFEKYILNGEYGYGKI